MGEAGPMASSHDSHDDHGHDDDHGHGDHGPADDLWVFPPIVIGLIVAIIITIVVGGTASGASPFG